MRRVLIGVAAGAVLALAAATGVSAYWQAQQTIPGGTVSSGSLDLQVDWAGGTTWPMPGPGGTISKRATITYTGIGDNLQVVLTGVASNTPTFNPYVTRSISLDDCSGVAGTPLPAAGYPATGALDSGVPVTVCVRYTLAASAPATLQGTDLAPHVVFQIAQKDPA